MKIHRFTGFLSVAIGLTAFTTAGCTPKDKQVQVQAATPAARDTADNKRLATTSGSTPLAPVAHTTGAAMAAAKWTDIKDLGFDARAPFVAGVKVLEATVDAQISELTAKRATMTGNPSLKDWDFAMKEMSDARTYLKSTGQELGKATAETWVQQKEKVGEAWARSQAAYAKVRSSTTS